MKNIEFKAYKTEFRTLIRRVMAESERGIREVRDLLGKQMEVIQIATRYWPVPLSDIFAGNIA